MRELRFSLASQVAQLVAADGDQAAVHELAEKIDDELIYCQTRIASLVRIADEVTVRAHSQNRLSDALETTRRELEATKRAQEPHGPIDLAIRLLRCEHKICEEIAASPDERVVCPSCGAVKRPGWTTWSVLPWVAALPQSFKEWVLTPPERGGPVLDDRLARVASR